MPEQSTHAGRNIAVVAGAVIIIAVGFLILKYAHAPVPGAATPQSQSWQPVTPDQKEQVLQSASIPSAQSGATASSSAAEVSQHAQILQGAQQQGEAPPPAPPSQQEKMKLLQSAGQ